MDLPKFHPNERVDLGDIEFLSNGQLNEFQRLQTNLVVGEATKRVLDGFNFSIFSPTVLAITLGKAVLAENRQTAVRYGQLVGGGNPVEGVAAQNVSFSGGAGAYSVFVRFVYGDGVQSNRAFWDTILATEEVQAVNTRKVAGWQAIVALTVNDPGADWLRIVDIAWDGVALGSSVITDKRTFLFEGPADSTPQTFRPTWGGGSDRNPARATNGVKTLERFASAVLKKIEEIQSDTPATRWWDAPVEPLSKKVSRFGDLTLLGDYSIAGNLTLTGSSPDILTSFTSVGVGPTRRYEFQANPATYFFSEGYSQIIGDAVWNVGPGPASFGGFQWLGNGTQLARLRPDGVGTGFEFNTRLFINGDVASNILPTAAGFDLGAVAAADRWRVAYAERWDVASANPVLDVENTSGAAFSKIHFFQTGAEATKYGDVGYLPLTGFMGYDVGAGGILLGAHVFSRVGVSKLVIEDTLVTLGNGVNLISADGSQLGRDSDPWGRAWLTRTKVTRSAAVVGNPGIADADVNIQATSTTANNLAALALTVSGTVAGDDGDGWIQYAKRSADNDVDLYWARQNNGAFVANRMSLDNLGVLTPGATGQDLGTTSLRWDVFGGTGNFNNTLTTDDIVPNASGSNIGSSDAAANRYSSIYCNNIRVGTMVTVGAGSGNDINLASAGNVLNIGGRIWSFGGTSNKESQIQLDQDFIGPDDDGNTSVGGAGVTSDVGIMMTFRSSNARVAGSVSPTADRQLHIATSFGPTNQCGAIKVQLQDGAGGTQTRGFIRVWFTPVGL